METIKKLTFPSCEAHKRVCHHYLILNLHVPSQLHVHPHPQGGMGEVAGINTYKIGQDKSAIVLLIDEFENDFNNPQKLDDSFAQDAQSTVFIPNRFNDDPMDLTCLASKKSTISNMCNCKEMSFDNQRIITTDTSKFKLIHFCYGTKAVIHSIIDHQ